MNFHKQKVIDKDFYEGAWTFDEGFEKFIELCGIKNLRPKTIKNYKENYNRFSKFIQECTKCQYIKELSQYDVDNYVLYLRGFEMKDTSVNAYMRSLRVLIYFWIESQQCVKMKIRIHKADKQPKKTYTDDELMFLLRRPDRDCDFTEYRNWVLCFLKSRNFTTWLNETLTGSTQQYVSLGEIRKISFKIPTLNELNKFNLSTNRIINMIIKETAELVKLQELKQLVISRISGM